MSAFFVFLARHYTRTDWYVLTGVLAAVAAWYFARDFRHSRQARRRLRWIATDGTVISAVYRSHDGARGFGDLHYCACVVHYRYACAAGAEHTGHFRVDLRDAAEGEEFCRVLPGRLVRVYYNPGDPAESVLKELETLAVAWPG